MARVERLEHVRHPAGIPQVLIGRAISEAGHPRQVATRAERRPGTREHGHPNRSVLRGAGGPGRELGDQAVVERIADTRLVEREPLDRAVTLDYEEFKGHRAPPGSVVCRTPAG